MNEQEGPTTKRRISRRNFLILVGAGTAGLVVGVRLATPAIRLRLAEYLEETGSPAFAPDAPPTAWFEIQPDNRVRLYLPKSEMGQGVHTALAQVAADELGIAWEQLEVLHASAGQGLEDPFGTAASNTVSSMYVPLREAAATMREMLRTEAARQLSALPEELSLKDGEFSLLRDPSVRSTYGQVVQNAGTWELPAETPSLKPESEFRYTGLSMERVDLPDKVTGEAVYGFDVRLPGMLYGAVARPPTIEATLIRAAPGTAGSQPGVIQVVVEKGLAGVVAETRFAAYSALPFLDVQWDPGKLWQQAEIEQMVNVGTGEGVIIQKVGDPASLLEDSSTLQSEYRTPMAFHAHLEPLAAVADVKPEAVRVWASTQGPVRLRGKIADALGIKEDTILVTPVYLGGGFGRKIGEEAAVEAARLSRATSRPVHVGWDRTEDFRYGFVRPPTHHILRARMGDGARIAALEHLQASGEVALPFLPAVAGRVLGADFGSWRGAILHYGVPNRRAVVWVSRLPVDTGWWRGLGLMPNIFAIESFMDELAFNAGMDPLEFRLLNLPESETGQRLRAVLNAAAQRAGWGTPLPAGSGRGIACSYDAGTAVAEVVEVAMQGQQPNFTRVTAAIDPGLIVNPDGVIAQTEGSITMGLSSVLLEEAIIKDGTFEAGNFDRYPLLRNADAPDIEVVLLQSGSKPYGVGEPPIGPIAAAAANAIYAATGERRRRLPLRNR